VVQLPQLKTLRHQSLDNEGSLLLYLARRQKEQENATFNVDDTVGSNTGAHLPLALPVAVGHVVQRGIHAVNVVRNITIITEYQP